MMETHAGLGAVFERSWVGCRGIAIEKDPGRCEHLVRQRPEWAVYCGDSSKALAAGLGRWQAVDVLDVDPYGDPWPTIAGFFAATERCFTHTMQVVVNDGLRNKTRMRGAWATGSLERAVSRHGNNLFPIYIEVCRELMESAVAVAGYALESFQGYYCGHGDDMTHYWARLRRNA